MSGIDLSSSGGDRGVVIDTEPLVAFLYDEPGASTVADVLVAVESGDATGVVAEATASAVLYLVARIEGEDGAPTSDSLRTADRDVRALLGHGLDLERADWASVGRIKAHGGCSFGDAHAVALADAMDATLLVGSDGDFADLPVEVDVRRIR